MNTKAAINLTLKVVGVAGLAGVTIVAPNALQGLDLLLKKSSVEISNQQRVLNELRRQGLVHITASGDQFSYVLTPAGAHRLQQVVIDEIDIPRPAKWDRRWRLVTFDIPVKQSKARKHFTDQLQSLGFFMLQRSMWVYPFECFTQVEQIAGHYNVLRHCSFMEIEKLDDLSTRRLVRHFQSVL